MNWWFLKKKSHNGEDVIEQPYEAKLAGEESTAEIDVNSPTWRFIRQRLQELLDHAREKNDSAQLDPTKTALLRGEIRGFKRILDLPNEGRQPGRPDFLSRPRAGEES